MNINAASRVELIESIKLCSERIVSSRPLGRFCAAAETKPYFWVRPWLTLDDICSLKCPKKWQERPQITRQERRPRQHYRICSTPQTVNIFTHLHAVLDDCAELCAARIAPLVRAGRDLPPGDAPPTRFNSRLCRYLSAAVLLRSRSIAYRLRRLDILDGQ